MQNSYHNRSGLKRLQTGEKTMIILMLVTAVAMPFAVFGQYMGPSEQKVYASVADVLSDPIDDRQVTLEGRVIRHEGGEYYRFADDSGDIRIELESEDMPKFAFDDTTQVRIIGEIDDNVMRKPYIEVNRVERIDAS